MAMSVSPFGQATDCSFRFDGITGREPGPEFLTKPVGGVAPVTDNVARPAWQSLKKRYGGWQFVCLTRRLVMSPDVRAVEKDHPQGWIPVFRPCKERLPDSELPQFDVYLREVRVHIKAMIIYKTTINEWIICKYK